MRKLTESSKKLPRGKPFAKGRSGNPGGRPKLPPEIVELRALARQHTEAAVLAIAGVMHNRKAPASAVIAAAEALLDRGWGRATTPLQHTGPDEGPVSIALSTMDWDGLLAKVRGRQTHGKTTPVDPAASNEAAGDPAPGEADSGSAL